MSEAAKDHLSSATHTGNAVDVKTAVDAGSSTIEHGSIADLIPEETFAEMKSKGIAYDPTLSIYEGFAAMRAGNAELLQRSLLQQAAPADLLSATRDLLKKQKGASDVGEYNLMLTRAGQNLMAARKAGVTLITGTDAGNMLVIHGPTVQHELELWVKAGIPPTEALQAATYNAAKLLRAADRIGSIRAGLDATFVVLDGDPLQDISNTEHINAVYLQGNHLDRSDLLEQFKP
jgi:imidazolonepropionase-like amidohydrolase